MVFLMKIACFL